MKTKRSGTGEIVSFAGVNPFAQGGEARIYVLPSDAALVAKIYKKPTTDHHKKLEVMIANPPDNPTTNQNHVAIAWPKDILLETDATKRCIGYVMPRIQKMQPLMDFFNPSVRRKNNPLFNYRYLVSTARNLATAVRAIHRKGYVIGDINESNILVSQTTLVTLVDTDSFQVKDEATGKIYRCPVGKPEYTPPELQNKDFGKEERSQEHDLFGLSVLIFSLLMEGTHPFDAAYTGADNPPMREDRIANGHFVYGKRPGPNKPKPFAPPYEILPAEIRGLFLRCFDNGHKNPSARPTAKEWVSALTDMEASLATCTVNEQHRFSNHLNKCPWCERTRQLNGRDPYPSEKAVRDGSYLKTLVNSGNTGTQRNNIVTPAPHTPTVVSRPLFPPAQQWGFTWKYLLASTLGFIPAVGGAAILIAVTGEKYISVTAFFALNLVLGFFQSLVITRPQRNIWGWTAGSGLGGFLGGVLLYNIPNATQFNQKTTQLDWVTYNCMAFFIVAIVQGILISRLVKFSYVILGLQGFLLYLFNYLFRNGQIKDTEIALPASCLLIHLVTTILLPRLPAKS